MGREEPPKTPSVTLDDHRTASIAGGVDRLRGQRPTAPPEPGALLGDRFLLQRLIGRGGSGCVFEARDQRLGQRVAVKVLHAEAVTPEGRERVRREVRAARFHHPHLVDVHDLHEKDGLVFLSLELVEGRSLKELLSEPEVMDIDEALVLGRQLADAVAHLHRAGIVHRDIKPGNVMVTSDGVAKLCDLGLARPFERGVTVTETAMVVGTPAYMAPEQGRSVELTPASDVYALGITLHQVLTGEVPLQGDTGIATLIRRQRERPPSVRRKRPDAPPWLDRLISQMLEPDPRARPTATEVARALEHRAFLPRLDRRLAGVAVAIIGLAAVVGAVLWWLPRAGGIGPDSPAARLATRWQVYDDRAHVEVFDGTGARVLTLSTSAVGWSLAHGTAIGVQRAAIADLDRDGLDDLVFADGDEHLEHQLQVYRRRDDGGLELALGIDIRASLEYEDRRFGSFLPRDLRLDDVTGDGRPEILLTQFSLPYYPGLARVITAGGRELARIWHPGHLTNVRTGDRDRDGRVELYLGGTTDFLLPSGADGSYPVVLVVEADWGVGGLDLSLFGPAERPATAVPAGVEAWYLGFPKQTLTPSTMIWEHAAIRTVRPGNGNSFLEVAASMVDDPYTPGRRTMARTFYFDRRLALVDAMWQVTILQHLGVDRTDPATLPDLAVHYWNGAAWQDEVCGIPQMRAGEHPLRGD